MKKIALLLFCLLNFSISFLKAQQSCAIYVDGSSGTDVQNCGTTASPCATINYGINTAFTSGYENVRIKAGSYTEAIELANGVSLWGGFDGQWLASADSTVINGTVAANGEYYALNGDSINTLTVLADLIIHAPDVQLAGKSSYGIHLSNSTGVKLQRVTVYGAKGGDGTNGADGTSSTEPGVPGDAGTIGDEFSTSCNSSSSGAGGAGATTAGHPATAGGNGGRGGFMDGDCGFPPDLNATDGVAGSNAAVFLAGSYGNGGGGGAASNCGAGTDGTNGQTVHGTGGAGAATSASISGLYWLALAGDNGTLGADGSGGGGGGGAGGCDDGTDSYGAGGGGGGSGGAAAPTAGSGGLSGGNSAAVFLLQSTCAFIDCKINLGTGGNGGNGGLSGAGAVGGPGGPGGTGVGTGNGGKGGDGGNGGDSGAGGGGAGGSAYGIYGNGAIIMQSATVINGGNAGVSGTGGTGNVAGTDGLAGVVTIISSGVTDSVATLVAEADPCISTGINELSSNQPVLLYPNPVGNELNILATSGIDHAEIYSITGALLATATKSTINTTLLVPGNYFVKVYLADGLSVKRFIKQ